MKKILVVATIYRCGEKIYPILPILQEQYEVDVLLLGQMHPKTQWYGTKDLRAPFYDKCRTWGINTILGPTDAQIQKQRGSTSLFKNVPISKYDLIIIDDNVAKPARGWDVLCHLAREVGVPTIGCPHGNSDFNRYAVRTHVPTYLDRSFVFGEKERDLLTCKHNRGRLIPGGIPANDVLKEYDRADKHILVAVSYVEGFNSRKKNKKGYLPFTERTFLDAGILDLQQDLGCPIVVKEKSRFKKGLGFSLSVLEKYDGVSVIMDVKDDNQLIADCACMVSAPSTLCFKAVQLGIPTVVLEGYGMTGNFYDFSGLVPVDEDKIKVALDSQRRRGLDESYISATLEGAITFSSCDVYVKSVAAILGE